MKGIFPTRLAGRLASSFAGFLILAGISFAEESKAPEPAKDYTKGFEMFSKLGVPDVKDAAYMQLNVEMNRASHARGEAEPVKMTGNAWMLSKKGDGGVFLDDQCRVLEICPAEAEAKVHEAAKSGKGRESRERMRLYQLMEGGKTANWKEADLEKDIQVLLDHLGKLQGGEDSSLLDSGGWGGRFLFAYHIHRKGHAKEANLILGHIFRLAGDSRLVVQQAADLVGAGQYGQAFQDFQKTRDWGRFSKTLLDLLAKMPSSWDQALLVKKLSDAVALRAAMKEPPAITGEGLTDEDRALARELAEPGKDDEGFVAVFAGMWITGGTGETPTDAGVMDRIRARKIKAFSLLLALAKDDTLTPFSVNSRSWMGPFHRPGATGLESGSREDLFITYQLMCRPATRGEFAQSLLRAVVAGNQTRRLRDEAGAQFVDDLIKRSREWYAKNGSKTESELLRSNLEKGDGNALRALVELGKEEDAQAVEKYFLESRNPHNDFGLVEEYVARRGVKAKDFVEKYVAKVKAEDSSLPETSRKPFEKTTSLFVAQFRELVSERTAEVLIKDVLSRPKKWDNAMWSETAPSLSRKLGDEKPTKALSLLLDAALETKDSLLRSMFLHLISYPATTKSSKNKRAATTTEDEAPLRPETHAEQWRKLITIQRTFADDPLVAPDPEDITVGQSAAQAMNKLYAADMPRALKVAKTLQTLGPRGWEALRLHWEARLAGKPEMECPPIPAAENVTPEQRSKIKTTLGTLDGDALWKAVEALSLDERLAVGEMTSGDEAFNSKLVAVANIVRTVRVEVDDPSWKAWGKACEGKGWTRKMAEESCEQSRKALQQGRPVLLTFSRRGCLRGVMIRVEKGEKAVEQYGGYTRGSLGIKQSAVVGFGFANGGDTPISARAAWFEEVAPGSPSSKLKPATDAAGDFLESDVQADPPQTGTIKDFWEQVETLCGPKLDVGTSASIIFAGIPAQKDESKK